MFKENYIKANDSIQPDEKFLERLRESVKQEEKHVQISEYVEFDSVSSIECYEKEDVVENHKRFYSWEKNMAVAACFVIVCAVAFTVGWRDWSGNGKGLGADIETVFREEGVSSEFYETTEEKVIEQYAQMLDWLQNKQVVIYELENFQAEQSGMEYLQQAIQVGKELSVPDRTLLVRDILAERYILTNQLDDLEQPVYYVAEFDDGSGVCFAVGAESMLYIRDVFGLQNMAKR